jgi:hypothetical protein
MPATGKGAGLARHPIRRATCPSPSRSARCPTRGCLGLLAVYTPTIAVTDTLRETFVVTATSTVSPTTVRAEAVSVALAPGCQLDEGGGYSIYLPLVLRNF